ncbi:hypothetical protein LSH36_253g03020 [Paralvinella palmiformis]|uniref:Transmembrane protein 161B n=1 Tax=Paralvinella palmiformis TaxID=53620 RepID=A0AAD9JLZ4_9ANNE|nr:hypothetical protein LSH36_253g03020 [Paralvinella palmiformis]
MAVLGVQLVFSMVLASILSRVNPEHSFARWILCSRLVRYLHPSDEELRKLAGVPPPSNKYRRKDADRKDSSFTVPKNLGIQLDSVRVTEFDVLPLHFYTEYQWLLDFSLCALFVYIMTELYYSFIEPKGEFNLSMMWGLLVLGFALKVLYGLTAIYFRTEEEGERIMCVMFGFFFLVLSMGILITNDDTLEFGLEAAYYNFSTGATLFLQNQGIESAGPASYITFLIILALASAILGAFLTFPGLRLARMHSDSLKYASERPLFQLLLHLNMVAPLIASLMWVKPITRDFLVHRGRHAMSDETFNAVRLWFLLAFCAMRFFLVWPHLQSHLNLAFLKLDKLRKEAGRIKAVELQKMIVHVFYYLCVVALQYLTPIIFLLFSVLMLKTLGNLSLLGSSFPAGAPVTMEMLHKPTDESVTATASQFSLALKNLRHVFTPMCFQALFSYLCWWICTSWFITSAFGLVYYAYFESTS